MKYRVLNFILRIAGVLRINHPHPIYAGNWVGKVLAERLPVGHMGITAIVKEQITPTGGYVGM